MFPFPREKQLHRPGMPVRTSLSARAAAGQRWAGVCDGGAHFGPNYVVLGWVRRWLPAHPPKSRCTSPFFLGKEQQETAVFSVPCWRRVGGWQGLQEDAVNPHRPDRLEVSVLGIPIARCPFGDVGLPGPGPGPSGSAHGRLTRYLVEVGGRMTGQNLASFELLTGQKPAISQLSQRIRRQ